MELEIRLLGGYGQLRIWVPILEVKVAWGGPP